MNMEHLYPLAWWLLGVATYHQWGKYRFEVRKRRRGGLILDYGFLKK